MWPQMPLGTLASQKAVNFSPRYKFLYGVKVILYCMFIMITNYQISKDSPQMPLGTLASQKAVNFSPRYKFLCGVKVILYCRVYVINTLITYLGIPSNRCFVSFRSNKSGQSLNFVTIISLSHWFAGRYYFFL